MRRSYKGFKQLENYKDGKRLSPKQTILAKCADCCCEYEDGHLDCFIPDCPNYPFMPYRDKEKYPDFKPARKYSMTEKHKKAFLKGKIAIISILCLLVLSGCVQTGFAVLQGIGHGWNSVPQSRMVNCSTVCNSYGSMMYCDQMCY
jgi:hypothetical protein